MSFWESIKHALSAQIAPLNTFIKGDESRPGTLQAIPFSTTTKVDRIMASLAAVESGQGHLGQIAFDAQGKVIRNQNSIHYGDRAHGAWQVMKANIGPWTRAAGYKDVSVKMFEESPEIQTATVRQEIQRMVDLKMTPKEIFRAWIGPAKSDGNMLSTNYVAMANNFYEKLGGDPDVKLAHKGPKAAVTPVAQNDIPLPRERPDSRRDMRVAMQTPPDAAPIRITIPRALTPAQIVAARFPLEMQMPMQTPTQTPRVSMVDESAHVTPPTAAATSHHVHAPQHQRHHAKRPRTHPTAVATSLAPGI